MQDSNAVAHLPTATARKNRRMKRAWRKRYHDEIQRLGPKEREECRRDPAWEARHAILDRVVCRICGAMVKTPLHNRLSHLRSRHPDVSTAAYQEKYPGAPLASIANAAKFYGLRQRDPQAVLVEILQTFVTPAELKQARKNPDWEKERAVQDFIVCRICGAKVRSELRGGRLGDHLNCPGHPRSKKGYLAQWPGAPWRPAVRVRQQITATKKWRARERADAKKWREQNIPKKRGRKPGTTLVHLDTKARIALAATLSLQGQTEYAMAPTLYPQQSDRDLAYKSTKDLFTRHRARIEEEKLRLRTVERIGQN